MAAGQPFLGTDVDEWLFGVLSIDPFLQQHAPGGFWANDPDQVSNGPWSDLTAYNLLDIANGSDGLPYRSLAADNVGNDPSSSPDDWALCFPCVRWWCQSPGRDVKRQDGRAGRAESAPFYIVTMLDRQHGGSIDKVGGTLGTLKLGMLRLVTLLDARNELFTTSDGRTSQFTAFQLSAYTQVEACPGGYDVMQGHRYQFRIQ
jgi:hypothetical protein